MPKKEKLFPIDTFGGRLQQLRKKRGYERVDLYYKVFDSKDGNEGLSPAIIKVKDAGKEKTVRNWESGKVEPRAETLGKICKALNCDAEYLWGTQESKSRLVDTIKDAIGFSEDFIEQLMEEKRSIPVVDSESLLIDDFFAESQEEYAYAAMKAKRDALECIYREPGLLEAINLYTGMDDSKLNYKLEILSNFLENADVKILQQYKNSVYKDELVARLNAIKARYDNNRAISSDGKETKSNKLSASTLENLFDNIIDACQQKRVAEVQEYERRQEAENRRKKRRKNDAQLSIFDI